MFTTLIAMDNPTTFYETNKNGMVTLDRDEQPDLANPDGSLYGESNNLSTSSPVDSNKESISEIINWLNYVSQLDPDDDTGAFLTPEDLKAVDEAYARLQLSGSGTPNFPSNQTQVASNADDEFIKRKMTNAIERAEQVASGASDHELVMQILYNRTKSVKIMNYQKGLLSGKLIILIPQGRSIQQDLVKEPGWKAEVEIIQDEEKCTRTIYARGICMNAITFELNMQKFQVFQNDYSCIDFEPLP